MKKWVWALVIVLAAGSFATYSFYSMNQPVQVEIGEVSKQSMAEKIYVNGKLEANEQTTVYSDANGLVKEVKVKEGERVQKGQVVLTLNVDDVNEQLQIEQIQLEMTQAERSAAQKEHFEQFKKLRIENPDEEVEPLELTQFDLRIKKHQVTIQSLEKKLMKNEIKVPAGGTVTELSVESGQLIHEGNPLLKISDLSAFRVVANINELDAGKVKIGMEASISGESFTEVYGGKVTEMAPVAVVTDPAYKDASVGVTIALQHSGPELRPGYNLNIEIEIPDEIRTVVPLTAIAHSEGKSYVYMVEENTAVKVEVKTGKENDEYVEIISGVGLGDQIVLAGTETLADGVKVNAI